jgi:hypothetical protein
VIATLSSSPTELLVTGSIDSAPSSAYRIEFFASDNADPSVSGEGRRLLGVLRVTTDASGHAAIDHELPPVSDGQWITATATLLAAANDTPVETSEFSAALQSHTQVALPTIQFTATHYDVVEGQEFAVLTVELTGRLGAFATVDFTTTDGTAGQRPIRSGLLRVEDYTTTAGTLVFRRGVTQREIRVPIRDDSIIEPDELFHVVLSNPSTGLALGDNSTADVTIHDNDPTVRFTASSSKRGESVSGRSQIQVELTPASNQTVTVTYAAVGGTATFNQDFRPFGGTLTFRPGETSKFINFTTISDTLYEGDETVIYELSSPTNAFLGDQTRHKVTIVDDDPQPPPADPGSTPATSLFIDLQTLPHQSYVQNLRPNDRDVFRVHLTAGENLAIDVDPAKFGSTTQGLATSTLVVIAPDGQRTLATIGRSPEPDTGIFSENPAYLFHATDTGDYFLRLQTTQTGLSGYRIWFHRLGGVSEHVPAPDLLNASGSMYAWFDGQHTVGITGPTGYGFTLDGPWQQQVTSSFKSVLTSQTLTLPSGSRLALKSPQGVELPLIATGAISIKTKPQRWGDTVGVVDGDAIKLPAAIDIAPVNNLLADAFGSSFATVGLLSGEWRISLGGSVYNLLSGFGTNVDRSEPIDQLQAGVPYLRKFGQSLVDATVGGFRVSQLFQPTPMTWVFDPADPMLYVRIPFGPGVAVSAHALLRFRPDDAPDGSVDAGITEFTGHVYANASLPLQAAGFPLSLAADLVINVDADRDGKPLGDLGDVGQLGALIAGDPSEVREILRDIQLGANGHLSVSAPVDSKILQALLTVELGRASVVLNGLADTVWLRGEFQGRAFAGTAVELPDSSVIMEGLIDLGSNHFLYIQKVSSNSTGIGLGYEFRISNEGVFLRVFGGQEWSAKIDYGAGTVSGKAKATFSAEVAIEIDDDGDVQLAGSISASGKLTARIAGDDKTLFSGSISASVRSRGFRFRFPKGVGEINLNVI